MNTILKTVSVLAIIAAPYTNSIQMKKINTETSTAQWTGKKVGGSHNGTIALKSGVLEMDNDQLTGGNFTIDMSSITVTDLKGDSKAKLEGHLKSDDFFGTSDYPEATLQFTDVQQKGNVAQVTANLTVKGTTQPINFELVLEDNQATTSLVIDRSKFNVKYGSKIFFKSLGDNFIYDDFTVDVTLKF